MPERNSSRAEEVTYTEETVSEQTSPKSSAATRDRLLSLVLGETLARSQEDPANLLRSLRQWRGSIQTDAIDISLCQQIVGQVLRFRLGKAADEIPEQLYMEVGEVLWNDPSSRSRIDRIWKALGAGP